MNIKRVEAQTYHCYRRLIIFFLFWRNSP